MNMWCTGLLCFLLNPSTDWLTNKLENILDLIPSTQAKTSMAALLSQVEQLGHLTISTLCINLMHLKQCVMGYNMISDLGLCHLVPWTELENENLTISQQNRNYICDTKSISMKSMPTT